MATDLKLLGSEPLSRSETEADLGHVSSSKFKFKSYFFKAISFLKTYKFYSILAASAIAIATFIVILIVAFYETEASRQVKARLIDDMLSGQSLYNCYPYDQQRYHVGKPAQKPESVGEFIVRTLTEHGYTIDPDLEAKIYKEFNIFMAKFGKIYFTPKEKGDKYINFRKSYEIVMAHNNNKNVSYKMALGQFSDKSPEEFENSVLNPMMSNEHYVNAIKSGRFNLFRPDPRQEGIPEQFIWDHKFLGPVLNQGACGSCWAFATAGAVQSLFNIVNNSKLVLSPQELVDCTINANGCKGGNPIYAFNYVRDHGLCTLNDYPYVGFQQKCSSSSCKHKIPIKNKMLVTSGFDIALAQGSPMVVGIDANGPFQHYSHGIFEAPCTPGTSNHAVLLVGYGVDKETGKKYWVIKNSWGPDWGEKGYARILRSDDGNGADCNLTKFGLMPL
ncbi:Papain family cysteine protease [Babesia microti strain RI]|uniref:Papain family cysteine protease n=1 Tax=Babesia microti (strain RI) TaxID=1133968 RepID=I7IA61_BABMR|nr:Papain family cysteine protease [Babesia microti strain RI]XP_012650562.1 Papain family cysteine protease [Babesia microti strain RI]CCF76151.1 Papain family cysteine protease [Babesia microti strain RI]CCF76154.1 Papain family cysteine protease [Babesia microti strain RI]|eukprot:XP_012650559.1 Papain family cysteine protease [Babesia microti strain RI]